MLKKLFFALSLIAFPAQAQNTFFPANPGDMIVKGGASAWVAVPGGTAGCALISNGPTAAATWQCALPLGFQLPLMAINTLWCNVQIAQAPATACNISQILNTIDFDVQHPPLAGSVPFVGTDNTWHLAPPATSGWAWTSRGAGQIPQWAPIGIPLTNIIVGTTLITGGIPNGVLFNFGGVLGNMSAAANSVLVTDGSSTPALSTTLPSGLTLPVSTITGALGVNIVPVSNTYNQALSSTQIGPTTSIAGPLAFNVLNVTHQGGVTGSGSDTFGLINKQATGFRVNMAVGGANLDATTSAGIFALNDIVGGAATPPELIGLNSTIYSTTSTPGLGQIYAGVDFARLGAGGSKNEVLGREIDLVLDAGSAANRAHGLRIVNGSGAAASGIHSAFTLAGFPGVSTGAFKSMFAIQQTGGFTGLPIATTGTILTSDSAITLASILDLTNFTVTKIIDHPNVQLLGSGNLTLTSTDGSAGVGPVVDLFRNSGSPAGNDFLGQLLFTGTNASLAKVGMAQINGQLLDNTAGSEDAQIIFATNVAGAVGNRMFLGQGLRIGLPTGGDPGVNSLNVAGSVLINNVAVPTISSADALTNKTINGVTLDNLAWSTYTPTISSQGGTITTSSATGRFKTLGKTIFFEVDATITTAGTGTGYLGAELPATTAAANYSASGFSINGGYLVAGFFGSSGSTTVAHIAKYDGTSIIADGSRVVITGVYETN